MQRYSASMFHFPQNYFKLLVSCFFNLTYLSTRERSERGAFALIEGVSMQQTKICEICEICVSKTSIIRCLPQLCSKNFFQRPANALHALVSFFIGKGFFLALENKTECITLFVSTHLFIRINIEKIY